MTTLVFLDTETTSLDSDRGEIWEIGAIVRDEGSNEFEYCWQIRPDLSTADPMSLRIGRYFERIQYPLAEPGTALRHAHPRGIGKTTAREVAADLALLLNGAHMVGAVPDFDARFLRRFFGRHGQCFTAHYHLIDVEALAVGYLHAKAFHDIAETGDDGGAGITLSLPWSSNALSTAVGVDPEQFDRHTALGDARWAKAIYDAVTGGGSRG
jgi:DNA polymerase III epsilon subunit-like protein